MAAELPLQAIADLLGVPQEDRSKLFDWSNQMMSYDDPDYQDNPDVAAAEILAYFMAMAEDRKANPRDDLVTKLITADIDGHALGEDEFGYFTIMLTVAGNETTRNAITHGMNAFFDFPDQWELFKRERPETTCDEIIRWATPVTVFQRTALRDTEVGGQAVAKGQRVGRPEPARRLRRPRRALLHRCEPCPHGGQPDLQRAGRPDAGHLQGRRATPAAARLDQRHQGAAGQLQVT